MMAKLPIRRDHIITIVSR